MFEGALLNTKTPFVGKIKKKLHANLKFINSLTFFVDNNNAFFGKNGELVQNSFSFFHGAQSSILKENLAKEFIIYF